MRNWSANCAAQVRFCGDEWLIGGRVQKWKPWANVLGLDATYTLDVENLGPSTGQPEY